MIIDAHIHFWRLARGDNLALEPWMKPLLRDHEPSSLRPQLDACGVDNIIVVQAAETLAENLYTLGLTARTSWIAGVVGWIDLRSPSLEEEVTALRATGRLLGFRPVREDNRTIAWLLDGRLRHALDFLASQRMVVDLLLQNPDEVQLVTHLVSRHPDLSFVLDHCGKPDIRNDRFEPWAADIAALSAHPNIACKLSGLINQAAPGAGAEVLRPYGDHVLRCFGPARTLWASDWPPLLLASDYQAWWDMTRTLLGGIGADDRARVLGGTAAHVYGLTI